MKRWLRNLVIGLTLLAGPAAAQFGACLPGFCVYPPIIGCQNSGHASAFLARTSGLDATHISAYTALLNGLDADLLSCKLDMLHVYATQDSTTAQLNLISTSYSAIVNGAPTFTADMGYNSTEGSLTDYIDTQFNTTTAVGAHFAQNSNHVSAWVVTDLGAGNPIIGAETIVAGANGTNINPRATSPPNTAFFRAQTFGSLPVTNTNTQGHFVASRTTGLNQDAYRNGSSIGSDNDPASNLFNLNFHTLGENDDNTPNVNSNSGKQIAMASIGSGLTSTDVTNFYNRLRTYMTAVGVP